MHTPSASRRALLIASSVFVAGVVILAMVVSVRASGTISLTSLGGTYTQDFNTLATAGTTNTVIPNGWDFVEAGTNANTTYAAGDGSSNGGNTYSFGSGTSVDRALGGLLSGSLNTTFGASFTNNTGTTITSLTISYTGEEWRLGNAGRTDRIDFQYSTNATSLATGSWTNVDTLDFITPSTGGTAGARDGNADANRTALSSTITGLTIPDGATFWIRWTDFDVSPGADDGLAVDDFSLTPQQLSTAPTATGSASPSSVQGGQSTVLSATVTPGANPVSTGLTVSCDLTAIGGSSTFDLPLVSGNTYSAQYSVPGGTAPQSYSLPCVVTDTQARSGQFSIALTVVSPVVCETGPKTSTAIHTIQGSSLTSSMAGQIVEVEGIVVGSFRSSSQLQGFYLQEPDATWDGDPATSEGIFIFDGGVGADVNVGDRVRVKGTVAEFSGSGSFLGATRTSSLTEIGNLQNELVCSSGNPVTRTTITLPTPTSTTLEQYEGMAVSIEQQLTVTGNFSLGTFGQLDLAPSVLFTPTVSPNQSTWAAQADLNVRSVIALDDASTRANANLYPTIFPQGGLSAANTLRAGDLVNYDPNTGSTTPLVGVLDDRFGAYRIEPTAPVTFFAANPRPAIQPLLAGVGGRFRAVSANVLNFFVVFNPPGRGAANQTELDHQKTKVIEALFGMNGDVYGLSEVQNAVSGNTGGAPYTNAALQSLVDGLNCRQAGEAPTCQNAPLGPFTFVDTLNLGASNGTDAIRSAIIYRTDRLFPVGGPAAYYQNDQNRPTLAQTFRPASGAKAAEQTFTFVVNHFRSKGSACGAGSDDPFQGNCNGMRLNMAQNVVSWLAGNPTADTASSRKLLLVGDFNAYYGEESDAVLREHRLREPDCDDPRFERVFGTTSARSAAIWITRSRTGRWTGW
ncbi:MAG: ExeM/NucH family extracellular endonuclease [Vicinamibacterales bacterium]